MDKCIEIKQHAGSPELQSQTETWCFKCRFVLLYLLMKLMRIMKLLKLRPHTEFLGSNNFNLHSIHRLRLLFMLQIIHGFLTRFLFFCLYINPTY